MRRLFLWLLLLCGLGVNAQNEDSAVYTANCKRCFIKWKGIRESSHFM